MRKRALVDVALQVFGKPYQTALCLLSLMRHCEPWIGTIFFIIESAKPKYDTVTVTALTDLVPKMRTVFMKNWLGVGSVDTARLREAAYRRSVRYQYAWEKASSDFLLVIHNDASFCGDVIAPIRKEGKWGLARNGSLFWKPMFAQCWAPQAAATDGEYIWAVAAPSYGAFTVACNATPWNCRFPSVTDLVLSPDGKHAAALGSQNNSRFQIAVDGKVWDDAFDMAWPVVFSPAGDRAAAKVRRDGKFALYVDGNAVIENLDGVWNPTFSPDGTVLLFCSLKDGVFSRHTVRL